MGTVRAVAKMGYEVVEFYSPYYDWSEDYTKQVRALLDDLGIRCNSTHNNNPNFQPANLQKAIDRNEILGSKYVVMASPPKVSGLDGWRGLAEQLSRASEALQAAGLCAGYHNHDSEFRPSVGGLRPIEILAANTPRELMLQLDVGTCVEAGSDPVTWIKVNPGRIHCIHCKEWAPGADKGYKVLFGEGASPWAGIFEAAESVGGIEYYLIEQEASNLPELEAAQRCLANWKRMRGSQE